MATYSDYAAALLSHDYTDRARAVLSDLDLADKRDVKTQYMSARIAVEEAIKEGKNYTQAEDRVNILLKLNERSDWLFPHFGGPSELLDLHLALIDIDLLLGHFADGETALTHLQTAPRYLHLAAFTPRVELRFGTLAVLRYQFADAQAHLAAAAVGLRNSGLVNEAAEAEFQRGKAYQFANDQTNALSRYAAAESLYIARSDRYDLERVLNNIGMVYLDRRENSRAGEYFLQSEQIARALADQLGIARALVNQAIVAIRQPDFQTATEKTLQAQEGFRLADNQLGLASATQQLANIYRLSGHPDKGMFYANQAVEQFGDLNEIRGLESAYAELGADEGALSDTAGSIRDALASFLLRRALGSADTVRNLLQLQVMSNAVGRPRFEEFLRAANAQLRLAFARLTLPSTSFEPPSLQ